MNTFISELRRRNVLRVAAAYALVSWILIEAGSVLLPTFGAPEWFFRVYVVIVLAGFLLAMIIAWIYEITPEGVRRERDIDRSSYEPQSSGKMNLVIIALLAIALGVSVTFNITGIRNGDNPAQAVAGNSIAVLPFSSRSIDEEDQFFTDGIHDDILTRLANIESLRVISRTSVNEYRDTSKNIRQIGRELGVATIVEGAVQRAGDRVRITVQLIDAATDEHIWASTFDKALTIQNLFEVQSEISARIAASLRTALTPEQELRLAATPTNNISAYAEYVRGRANLSQRTFASLQQARQNFMNAIELDPDYAQAHAALAQTLLVTLSNHKSIAPSEAFSMSENAIDKALSIDPGLGDAYAVRGLLQTMRSNNQGNGRANVGAAESFQKAIKLSPNLADTYVWFASMRAAEGDTNGAIELLTTALSIDPLSRIPYVNLPGNYAARGQNAAATKMLREATELFPDWSTPYNYLSSHMQKLGRLDQAVAWGIQGIALSSDPLAGGQLIGIYKEFGHDETVLTFMENFPQDHPFYFVGKSYWHFIEGDYEATVAALEQQAGTTELSADMDFINPLLIGASILSGDYDRAYSHIARSNPTLTSDSDVVIDRHNVYSAVLLAFVEQKRHRSKHADELLKKAQPVVDAMPRLGMSGHGIRDVHILTLQGRLNAAIETLLAAVEEGFVSSQGFDAWGFESDPIIEPLRSDPRFPAIQKQMNDRIDEMRRNVEQAKESGDWSELLAKSETV